LKPLADHAADEAIWLAPSALGGSRPEKQRSQNQKAKTARAKPGRKRAAATKQATAQEDPATNTQPKSDNENV